MGLLDFFKKSEEVESKTITKTIFKEPESNHILVSQFAINSANDFFNSMVVDYKLPTIKKTELEKRKKLESLGFVNAEETVELREKHKQITDLRENRNRIKKILEFYIQAVDYFGKDVIIIPKSAFAALMEKYNMVCGDFSQYTGSIPEYMIDLITETKDKLENLHNKVINYADPSFDSKKFKKNIKYLIPINKLITRREVKFKKPIKYPFLEEENFNRYSIVSPYYSGAVIRNKLRSQGFSDDEVLNIDDGVLGNSTQLFICAPAHEMKNLEQMINPRVLTDDPFICSECLYDTILIYHMWGEEATDELLTKFKQLSIDINNYKNKKQLKQIKDE